MTKKDATKSPDDDPEIFGVLEDDDVPAQISAVSEVEPKVGDAAYDWSAHYDTKDLYTHTFPDGKVVALRKFQTILSDTFLYKIRKLPTDLDFRISCIDEASCETAQAVMESLATEPSADPLKDMFTAWTAAGTSHADGDEGLTPGK